MINCDEGLEIIQPQMFQAKRNEHSNGATELQCGCKESDFIAAMPTDLFVE